MRNSRQNVQFGSRNAHSVWNYAYGKYERRDNRVMSRRVGKSVCRRIIREGVGE